jgi:predicted acyltransferase
MTSTTARAPRLVSLDAFRGATIALMVLVNTAGDGKHVYWPLQHAAWHGWTPTDVVFPSFLWIVGVALTLSLERRRAAGDSDGAILGHAARRAAILFALGMFLYAFPDFDLSTTRILGVLQRIAICYFAAVAIWLRTGVRGQVLWILGLFAVYWGLMAFAPTPGYGAGRLDVEGNFAHYIDRITLGRHNYAHTRTWDPEGLVSTLPAVATAVFGMLAGRVVAWRESLAHRAVRLAVIGAVLLAAGMIWDHWLPINKKLWTCSFSTFMAGLDFLLLAGFLWVCDGLGWRRPVRPFVILGMNAIAIYMASEMIEGVLQMGPARQWIYRNCFASLASPYNASLLYAVVYTLLMFGIAWVMYRRGWFLKI